MAQQVKVNAGLGLAPITFLIFMTLKLLGHISWSWWWVTCPLWAPLAVCGVIALFCVAMAALTGQLSGRRRR